MLKLLLLSIILVAFVMVALSVKLFFDKDAEFTTHSCGGENKDSNDADGCTSCEIKEVASCSKNKK